MVKTAEKHGIRYCTKAQLGAAILTKFWECLVLNNEETFLNIGLLCPFGHPFEDDRPNQFLT
jgi:hypothetical protein